MISVKESLLPSRNFLWPAETFLERTYLPSLERSLRGWYIRDLGLLWLTESLFTGFVKAFGSGRVEYFGLGTLISAEEEMA